MSLWLCLRFDLLPLEALLKQHGYASDTATIVVAQRRVLVCDESASLAGVMPTQTVSTAQALLAHNKHRSLERALRPGETPRPHTVPALSTA